MNKQPSVITYVAIAAVLAIAIVMLLPGDEAPPATRVPVSLSVTAPEANDTEPAVDEVVPEKPFQTVTIKNGDSMARIFNRLNLSASDLHLIVHSGPDASTLRSIKPGETLGFQFDDDGRVETMRYEISALQTLWIRRNAGTFTAHLDVQDPEILMNYQFAEISADAPSLYQAGKKAGLSDNMILELANIFQWDISFALDLREGDTFALIYEEFYVDGEKVKEGAIQAAYFRNMGREYRALRYEQDGFANYFAPDGRSLRKAFIRDPVHFTRISGRFNPRRLHPIHKRVMPHRGIDYAAPTGTPVVAAGDGKITIARQNNASGKYVVIQHGEQYTTKYLHLSKFGRGIRAGRTVKQGQVIGYVGSTGWATGPHLHYEFLVGGVHRNPRTVTLPKADPITASDLASFEGAVGPMLTQLDSVVGATSLARSDEARGNGGE